MSTIATPTHAMTIATLSATYSLVHDVTGGPQGALPGTGVGQAGMFVTHVIGSHASATPRPTTASPTQGTAATKSETSISA